MISEMNIFHHSFNIRTCTFASDSSGSEIRLQRLIPEWGNMGYMSVIGRAFASRKAVSPGIPRHFPALPEGFTGTGNYQVRKKSNNLLWFAQAFPQRDESIVYPLMRRLPMREQWRGGEGWIGADVAHEELNIASERGQSVRNCEFPFKHYIFARPYVSHRRQI